MNEPTDAEIEQLYLEETGFDLNDSPAALLDFARIVLAKWGQPAQKTVTVVPATGDVWLKHDDDLRYVRRVLEAGRQMTDVDQRAAIDIVQGLRVTARSMAVDAKKPAQAAESRTIPDREIPGIVERALQELEGLVKYATSTYGHWDMRRAKGALSDLEWWARRKLAAHAQAAEPVAWLRNTTDPQPHAVTNLKYRSAADADAGIEYVPVYTAPKPVAREPVESSDRRWLCLLCKSSREGHHGVLDDSITPCPNGIKGGQHGTE